MPDLATLFLGGPCIALVLGMMRNVAETRAAEPESQHPIVEAKLAEAKLWELTEQRKRQARISGWLDKE